MDEVSTKRCGRCRAYKPTTTEHFGRVNGGWHSSCKPCRKLERATRGQPTACSPSGPAARTRRH